MTNTCDVVDGRFRVPLPPAGGDNAGIQDTCVMQKSPG